MKYFYDCEFLEDGRTIELISIGIAAEDSREYYAVNSEVDFARVKGHRWLLRNVVPSLPITDRQALDRFLAHPKNSFPQPSVGWVKLDVTDTAVRPRYVIANEVREFLLAVDTPELWADYCAYDHVALCQLWGTMINLPDGIPMWTNDLQQWRQRLGVAELPEQESGLHNALEDARHNRVAWEYLQAEQLRQMSELTE